jgi:hypothetical protein
MSMWLNICMELTEQQQKMVIEYFAQQAAEDMPDGTEMDREKHLWMTRYTASLAVKHRIGVWYWESLVDTMMDLQTFDRDPAAYLHDYDYPDTQKERDDMRQHLENQVSWSIDNVLMSSGV